ncbi:MAG: RidA family protein [Firmicutes bacterium]|nr:RidA family protein [Bacillota bacterium]
MQNKKIIATNTAPKAIGPYSQGIQINNFFYFSGQIPLCPISSKIVEGGIVPQTKQVLKNIDALLKSQNLTSENVIKTTVFLIDLNDFSTVNAEYATYFNTNPPARSCVQVCRLPLDSLVEIEIIACTY